MIFLNRQSSTTTAKFLKKVAMKMISSLIGKSLNNRVMNFYIHNHHHQVLTIYICSYTLVVVVVVGRSENELQSIKTRFYKFIWSHGDSWFSWGHVLNICLYSCQQ